MTIRVFDMFCGAGGSSCGAALAGARLVGAVDAWSMATMTIKDNHPEAAVSTMTLRPRSKPSAIHRDLKVDLLLASPECTNHSPAKGSKPRDESSRGTARYVLEFAKILSPRWLVIENVVQMRNWSGYADLREKLDGLGFHVEEQILDASDFGVPQSRRRLFLICDRKSVPPRIDVPEGIPSSTAADIIQWDVRWPTTALYAPSRARATLDRAERAIAALGEGVPFIIVYYGSDGAGGWQSLERPLRTLTTLDRFGLVTWHANEPRIRMLQVDELKRAMGFPDSYRLPHGTRRDRVKMLGNGVCPPVMRAIVERLTKDGSPGANSRHAPSLDPLRPRQAHRSFGR